MKTRAPLTMCVIAGWAIASLPAWSQTSDVSPTRSATSAALDWHGVWVAERRFGPDLAGPVSLSQTATGWIAQLRGDIVPAVARKNTDGSVDWSFDFFELGRFAGRQAVAGAPIRGHWIQPPGPVQSHQFATPVQLESFDGGAGYLGAIRPFSQSVSLNIPLIADTGNSPDGRARYRSFLRNPERNLGIWFPLTSVEVAGEELRFLGRKDELLATGRSVEPGKRFTMVYPRFGETFEFTRRTRADAPGFYPRRSTNAVSSLARPAETGDGWRTAEPGSTGLDTGPLTELVASIAASEPGALREPYIHGLLIAHRGKLVMEEYFHGFDRETPHDSRSAGKSIGSALLGIALHKGIFESLDTPVYPLFGGVAQFANPDPRKAGLTLRHVVSMSPGLDCRDGSETSLGDEDRMQSQSAQPDWYRFALDLPLVSTPGETSFYCTAGINLIGGAIQHASGQSLLRFFQEQFADPLEISYYQLNLSPMGPRAAGQRRRGSQTSHRVTAST